MIISQNQTGFIKGRSIAKNVLLTQEIIRDINRRDKFHNIVVKLDMAKAYDRVTWVYMTKVMRRFGFTERIIDMIWRLMRNNCYSVLVNGKSYGFFQSSRGLKQGDPLSPDLFIIAAEVLSRSLGFGMPKWSEKINHQLYVDDTILFCSGHNGPIRKMMNVLVEFEKVSGQLINLSKIFLYIHEKVPLEVKNIIRSPMNEDGIGLRSLHLVADALFAKLWWNFRTSARTLWSNFMWNKYCKKKHPVIAQVIGASLIWKKMIQVREEVEHNIWGQIKTGELPQAGYIKCNTDRACRGNPGIGSYGFYLRNEEGDLIYAQGENIGFTTNMVAEMRALQEEIKYCKENNIIKVQVESDSLILVRVLKRVWQVPWEVIELLEDIRRNEDLIDLQNQHIYREGTALADYIANLAIDMPSKLRFHTFQ
ncbi:hypothetical protein FXO37_05170 [Capsicum annuum]|nr:hypothetical protein FXO37_05170 [Capsicum annuum]